MQCANTTLPDAWQHPFSVTLQVAAHPGWDRRRSVHYPKVYILTPYARNDNKKASTSDRGGIPGYRKCILFADCLDLLAQRGGRPQTGSPATPGLRRGLSPKEIPHRNILRGRGSRLHIEGFHALTRGGRPQTGSPATPGLRRGLSPKEIPHRISPVGEGKSITCRRVPCSGQDGRPQTGSPGAARDPRCRWSHRRSCR